MHMLSQGGRGWSLFFTLLGLLCLPGFARAAEEPNPDDEGPSLEFLLKSAISGNGQIKEVAQDVEIAKSQVELAKSALFPKGNVTLLAAPIFEATGNALQSQSNWGKWGPYARASAEVVQPIYSFGMIANYRKAADGQVTAKTELTEVKRAEIVYNTKEFYYGYLMASDLENLVDDLIKFLEDAVTTAEKATEEGKKSSVKPHDIYKLKSALEDLRQKKLQAKAGRQTAERAVSWVSTAQFESLRRKTLEPEEYEAKTLPEYITIAKGARPEFKALAAGQEARAALRDAKRAQSYPVVFVGGFATLPWSPVRDHQPSVFAYDPYNQMQGGLALGLRLDIDFKKHSAEAAEQEAELMKLKATESYAAPGIDLQVKKAFWEFEQARDGLEVATRRKQLSKKWFVTSAMGWSIGLTAAKDLLEALEADGLAKKNYIETVYQLNIALAKLSQAVGQEVTKLRYR